MKVFIQEIVVTEATGGKARRTDQYVHALEIAEEDLFTPCAGAGSLLEPVQEPAENAAAGDVILHSPDCSSFDRFAKAIQNRSQALLRSVKSTGGGGTIRHPNINGKMTRTQKNGSTKSKNVSANFDSGFCEGKPRGKNTTTTSMKERQKRRDNDHE